jgi:hypothetical protein
MRLVRSDPFALSLFVSLFVSLLSIGCPKPTPELPDATDEALVADARGGDGGSANVDPYPVDTSAPPVPLAVKLCDALTGLPEKKAAACCNATPAVGIMAGCTRHLSAALRHDTLEVDEKDVDACIADFEQTLAGCDWVGSFVPGPPAACRGIFKGKRAAGQTCRSSLECAGDLRCNDYNRAAVGKCRGAGVSDEASCGGSVDALATYTRQTDVDNRHPECKERCVRRKCQKPLREGEGCLTTSECLEGMQCMEPPGAAPAKKKGYLPTKQCITIELPAKVGAPCPDGACAAPLQCVRGKCSARKGTGAACTDEFECRGGCLKDGGNQGTCGPRCASH